MRFSQRMGLTAVRDVIQHEEVDAATRNRLWDVVWSCFPDDGQRLDYHPRRAFYQSIWIGFFEQPADTIPGWTDRVHEKLRERFFQGTWYEMYDVLQYVCQVSSDFAPNAKGFANEVLEGFLCAYRFVGDELVKITDEKDIQAIEAALEHPLTGVRAHIAKALACIGDRANPDAQNSIKESISAVESICCSIVGKKTTLGAALKKLESNGVVLHQSLKSGWGSLYGWTSDEQGVRHAMQDESAVSTEDAVYMLVSCSAFVSLLTEKARKAAIDLKPVAK